LPKSFRGHFVIDIAHVDHLFDVAGSLGGHELGHGHAGWHYQICEDEQKNGKSSTFLEEIESTNSWLTDVRFTGA
jgi:hypothetical protein